MTNAQFDAFRDDQILGAGDVPRVQQGVMCGCPRHLLACEQVATRLTYDRDPLYVCEDCAGTEDESRPLTETERETD